MPTKRFRILVHIINRIGVNFTPEKRDENEENKAEKPTLTNLLAVFFAMFQFKTTKKKY